MPIQKDRGAAAVEFALIASLVLIPLLLGLMEFGWAFFHQGSLAQAAREAARYHAINNDQVEAIATAAEFASSAAITLGAGDVVVTPAVCTAGQQALVTIEYAHPALTGFFFTTIPLKATGAMRCGG